MRQNVQSGTSENVVYILALRASNAPHDLDYYIGETCNFERRYRNHNNLNSKGWRALHEARKGGCSSKRFHQAKVDSSHYNRGFPVHELPGGRKKYFRKKFEFRLRHTCNQFGHCVRSQRGSYIPFRHHKSASRLANQLSTVLKGWRKDYPNHNLTSWLWSDQVSLPLQGTFPALSKLSREATIRDENAPVSLECPTIIITTITELKSHYRIGRPKLNNRKKN